MAVIKRASSHGLKTGRPTGPRAARRISYSKLQLQLFRPNTEKNIAYVAQGFSRIRCSAAVLIYYLLRRSACTSINASATAVTVRESLTIGGRPKRGFNYTGGFVHLYGGWSRGILGGATAEPGRWNASEKTRCWSGHPKTRNSTTPEEQRTCNHCCRSALRGRSRAYSGQT